MIQLLALLVSPTDSRIVALQWYDPRTGAINSATEPALIDYLRKGGRIYVCDGTRVSNIGVLEAANANPRLDDVAHAMPRIQVPAS